MVGKNGICGQVSTIWSFLVQTCSWLVPDYLVGALTFFSLGWGQIRIKKRSPQGLGTDLSTMMWNRGLISTLRGCPCVPAVSVLQCPASYSTHNSDINSRAVNICPSRTTEEAITFSRTA